jgi:hypothetical protein
VSGPSAVAVAFKRVRIGSIFGSAQYAESWGFIWVEYDQQRVPSALRLWSCWRPRSLRSRAEQVLFVHFQHGGTQLAVTASGHSEAGVCHKKSPGVWEDGTTIGEQLQQVP